MAWLSRERSLGAAWEACPAPAWRIWVAGALGIEVSSIVGATMAWADDLGPSDPEAAPLLRHVLEQVERSVAGAETWEACAEAAEDAERAALEPVSTFRQRPGPAYALLARAAAWIARSAEGLVTARTRAEAERMQQAQRTASYLGAGLDVALPREAPLRLDPQLAGDDALHGELLYVVAAAAEAAEALAAAEEKLAPRRRPAEPRCLADLWRPAPRRPPRGDR